MVRNTYTYRRINTEVLFYEDQDDQEARNLMDMQTAFFNNNIDFSNGEKWSLVQIDDHTKVFTIECSSERLIEIQTLFANNDDLVRLRENSDLYNTSVGTTCEIETIEI